MLNLKALARIPETMVKLVAKLPLFVGWTPEAIRGSTLTNLLSQHVNLHAIESLQTRKDHSATFFVHQSVVPDLLKASGRDGLFIKGHADYESQFATDSYWLPDGISFQDGLQLAQHSAAKGLVAKSSQMQPRFAIRFSVPDDILTFTKDNQLPTFTSLGRWRVEGLHSGMGAAGAIAFLESKGWQIDELLYFGSNHVVFTSKQMGSAVSMFYQHQGRSPQQLRFKALNSLAKQQSMSPRTAAAAPSSTRRATEPEKRAAFLKSLPKAGQANTPTPKKPGEKRPAEMNTGESPAPKQNAIEIP